MALAVKLDCQVQWDPLALKGLRVIEVQVVVWVRVAIKVTLELKVTPDHQVHKELLDHLALEANKVVEVGLALLDLKVLKENLETMVAKVILDHPVLMVDLAVVDDLAPRATKAVLVCLEDGDLQALLDPEAIEVTREMLDHQVHKDLLDLMVVKVTKVQLVILEMMANWDRKENLATLVRKVLPAVMVCPVHLASVAFKVCADRVALVASLVILAKLVKWVTVEHVAQMAQQAHLDLRDRLDQSCQCLAISAPAVVARRVIVAEATCLIKVSCRPWLALKPSPYPRVHANCPLELVVTWLL